MSYRTRRPFQFERLEARELKAGDVRAYLENGNLIINEVPSARQQPNQVMVLGLGNGQIRVTTTPGGQSKVADGAGNSPVAYRDFTVSGDVTVSLAGGDDVVQIGQILRSSDQLTKTPEVSAPNVRSLFIYTTPDANGPTDVSDNDKISIVGLNARGAPSINGLNWTGLSIDSGRGDDEITIGGAGATINLGVSSTKIATKGQTQTPSFIKSGSGIDRVTIADLTNSGPLTIDTGADADQLTIRNLTVGDLSGQDDLLINTGGGADSISLKNSRVADSLTLQTYNAYAENEIDSVNFEGVSAGLDMHFWLGGGDDQMLLTSTSAGHDIELNAFEGADTITMLNCTAVDQLIAAMGNGNDILHLDGLTAGSANLLGEGEYDILILDNPNVSNLSLYAWEEFD